MVSFPSPLNPVVESAIIHAARRPISSLRLSLRPPLDYQSNRLYDLQVDDRHWIVKEFLREAEWRDAPRREFHALQVVAPLDIAPQPVFYDPPVGPVVIYEYLDGTMWNRRRPSPSELTHLAQVWLKMNGIPTAGLEPSRGMERTFAEFETNCRASFHRYADWAAANFPGGRRAADLCLELLERCRPEVEDLARRTPRFCFCRADPRFANVITRPDGRLGMVDWEDSGLRDPARDLADLMTHPNQEDLLSPDEWQPFLEPYLAVQRAIDVEIEERMHLYLRIFPLFWLSVLLPLGIKRAAAGQLAGWAINDLPANQRLRRYLFRALQAFNPRAEDATSIDWFPC